MTARIVLESLSVRDFRNVRELEMAPSPRVNVLSGDNGQGKTSLLEALYFVATSRSFRAERPREMLRHGAETAVIRAQFAEERFSREQRATISGARRHVFIDGKAPETLAAYATRTPVVVFHPGDLTILTGAASERRTLLDRIALFIEPGGAHSRLRYSRATKARQAVLDERGVDAPELAAIERVMAADGAALGRARSIAAERLTDALRPSFASMAAPGLTLSAHFAPGGSLVEAELGAALAARRALDQRRRRPSYGPHRDDLELCLDGRDVRRHASQGQIRILTLALKTAELECVRAARRADPILLLDDVSSELDPSRTGAVFEFLRRTSSQVFVTTTRPDLFVTRELFAIDRSDFRLDAGVISTVGTPAEA